MNSTECELFLRREPGIPLPADLQEKVYEAIAAMAPDMRGTTFWAFKGLFPNWRYSLLGLLCMMEDFEITHYEKNEQEVPCTEFLLELGFSRYDIWALREIDSHTFDMEVVLVRAERYMETGCRMERPDDLTEFDALQRKAA